MKKHKRKYFRKCPYCGRRFEQSDMIRTNTSPTGWSCKDCYEESVYETTDDWWDEGYSSNGN